MMFPFIIVILFYSNSLTEPQMNSSLPLLYVLYNATGSKHVTNALLAFLIILLFVAQFNAFASVSRLIWVFAKDKGLPFSRSFAYVGIFQKVKGIRN